MKINFTVLVVGVMQVLQGSVFATPEAYTVEIISDVNDRFYSKWNRAGVLIGVNSINFRVCTELDGVYTEYPEFGDNTSGFVNPAGLNSEGLMVGTMNVYSTNSNIVERGFIFDIATRALKTEILFPGEVSSQFIQVTDQGHILARGYSTYGGGSALGAVVVAGAYTGLGSFNTIYQFTYPADMNQSDQVTGRSYIDSDDSHAFLWEKDKLVDLGTLAGGRDSWGASINDCGIIAGMSETQMPDGTYRRHSVLFSAGRIVDLGIMDLGRKSDARIVNNFGLVLGSSNTTSNGGVVTYVWSSGVMRRLAELIEIGSSGLIPYSVEVPTAVNDHGDMLTTMRDGLHTYCVILHPKMSTGEPGRITNVSVRASARSGEETSIAGFVLGGGTKPGNVLTRVVGPSLEVFQVHDFCKDPRLELFSEGSVDAIASNDNWEGAAGDLNSVFSNSGAFLLLSGSTDAALVETLPSGNYTVHANATELVTDGVVLSEIYDATRDPDAAHLINASMRVWIGDGSQIGILGFAISGDQSVRVLIRAVGPSLSKFGVNNTLNDPQLFLYREQTPMFGNDNWGDAVGNPSLAAAVTLSGAFRLPDGSKDGALLAQLEPGNYTVHVAGADGGTGVALIEIYLLP